MRTNEHGSVSYRSTASLRRSSSQGKGRDETRRSAEEGEMSREQLNLLKIIEHWKRSNPGRNTPTWTELLECIRLAGYRKVRPSDVDVPGVEDWTEPADAPHGCRSQVHHRTARRAAHGSNA